MKTHCQITQQFGENANSSYADLGLLGHPATDESCSFVSPIFPYKRIFVYKILNRTLKANDGSGYWGVFGIDSDGHEWSYGHCIPTARVGQWYDITDIIGFEGNRGTVYSGSTKITPAMQDRGDIRGFHRHVQKRLCRRVRKTYYPKHYLSALEGGLYRDKNGFYYEIPNYNNGFNGCVDWTKDTTVYPQGRMKPSDMLLQSYARAYNVNDPQAVFYRVAADIVRSFGS